MDACEAMKRAKMVRVRGSSMMVPSDVLPSVAGTDLDPVPAFIDPLTQ